MGGTQDIVADIIDFRLAEDAPDAAALVVRTPSRPASLSLVPLATRDLLGATGSFQLEARGDALHWRAQARS